MSNTTVILIAILALFAGLGVGLAWARAAAARRRTAEQAAERSAWEAKLAAERAERERSLTAERERLAADAARSADASLAEQRAALVRERAGLEADRTRLAAEIERQRLAGDTVRLAEERVAHSRTDLDEDRRRHEAELRRLATDRQVVEATQAKLTKRDEASLAREQALGVREAASAAREATITAELARVAGLPVDEAKAELMGRLDKELAAEQAERIAIREKDIRERQKELAVEVISRAVQRYAAEHTAETTGARIKLPDEAFKGRIIGKEGRNIQAFEQIAGVDVVMDEAPDVIVVSCFDPVRREVARRALVLLIEDGRIQPARIEEVIARVRADLDREVALMGEDAAFACEVSGIHPQILRLLGKLHFRTSYGQNVLVHSQEAAFLCGAMASDLGLDPKMGRRCGLLHDVGKAIDHEQEGSHPQLGYEALKRYGESETVANAALAHHEGHEPLTAYTVLAAAADAISAARPGARRANTEQYLKRIAQLEAVAVNFPGVQKAYAVQAGRELRVLVNQHTIPDSELPRVARDITRAIASQVAFPGEIKVTLIREIRHVAIAR